MPYITIDENRCKGCGLCTTVCPHDLLAIAGKLNGMGYPVVQFGDAERCIGCAICARICPDVAIMVYREEQGD